MKLKTFLPVLGYIIVVLILFWPILFPTPGTLIFGDDIHRSYHFFRQFFHDAIASGEFPWWNPYLFSGEPLIANPSIAFWYPFNWLFIIFPYAQVYSIIIPVHIFIAMTGMYWLARKWLLREVAWTAGLLFGLSGFFIGRIWEGHIDILTSAPYVPIVFGLFWQAFEKKTPKTIVLASVFYAIEMFAGYQTMAYFTAWAIGAAAILFCIKDKSLKTLVILLIGIILAVGIAALQIIPSAEFFRQSIRTYQLPYSWAVMGASSIQSLKLLINPFLYGAPGYYKGPGPNYGELAGYIGKIPLALAAITTVVFSMKKNKEIVFVLICLGIFSLWVSLAWNAPLDLQYFLWKYIPIYHYLRVPSRHLILFVFSVSLLAGFGLSFIKQKAIKLILIILVISDLILFARQFITTKPDPITRHNQELISLLQKDKSLSRFLPNFNVGMATRDALDFDAAMSYKIFSASGYDPAILRNYYEFIVAANKQATYDVQQSDVQIPYIDTHSLYLDFLNIKYILVPSWFDSVGGESARFVLRASDTKKDYWNLYENKNVLPRFFLVPQIEILSNRQEVAAAIRNRQHDVTKTILTDQMLQKIEPNCQMQTLLEVNVISYRNNSIVLMVDVPCNAFLATSEIFYPGWEATIDGKQVTIMENNLAFRALYVPAGKHQIVFSYVPKIFYLSFLISISTGVISFIWIRKS